MIPGHGQGLFVQKFPNPLDDLDILGAEEPLAASGPAGPEEGELLFPGVDGLDVDLGQAADLLDLVGHLGRSTAVLEELGLGRIRFSRPFLVSLT